MNNPNNNRNGQQQPSSYEQQNENYKQGYYTSPLPGQAPHYVEPEIVYGIPIAPATTTTTTNQYHASAPPMDMSVSATAPPPPTIPPQQFYASAPPKIPTATVVGNVIPPPTVPQQQQQSPTSPVPTSSSVPTPKLEIHTRYPIRLDACPYCNTRNMKTKAVTSPNIITCIATGVTCIVCWPLFWIPLCMDRCQSTKHYCSVCNRELDEIEPLTDCCVTQRG